ncbi:hypothetical protein DIPPA_02914 [Diplonema papillatum]|nr:hypothetical protein DIPPA_02914 [Diplonema papillatum]
MSESNSPTVGFARFSRRKSAVAASLAVQQTRAPAACRCSARRFNRFSASGTACDDKTTSFMIAFAATPETSEWTSY